MTKIAIIGNAGGGKSTVSRQLRDLLDLPLYAIDRMQWLPNWTPVPRDDFFRQHKKVLNEARWVIDGWGDFQDIEERFHVADTIVLIDYPLWQHYYWALKRQVACLFRPRIDGPVGCPMLPMTWRLAKMIWAIDRRAMPKLRALTKEPGNARKVYHIRSSRDLRHFYEAAERCAKAA